MQQGNHRKIRETGTTAQGCVFFFLRDPKGKKKQIQETETKGTGEKLNQPLWRKRERAPGEVGRAWTQRLGEEFFVAAR